MERVEFLEGTKEKERER